ncbi:hypothetical protein ACSBR2_016873 [Camellia fascicularis]
MATTINGVVVVAMTLVTDTKTKLKDLKPQVSHQRSSWILDSNSSMVLMKCLMKHFYVAKKRCPRFGHVLT